MENDPQLTNPRSQNQQFLVGPSLYLRPVDLDDASTAAIWRAKPFPAPVESVQDELKQRLEVPGEEEHQNQLLLICQRDNDKPVGSLTLDMDGWRTVDIDLHLDPLASEERKSSITTEVIGFLIPWLLEERNLMAVSVSDLSNRPIVESKVQELSGRIAAHHRELYLVDGVRRDRYYYQFFNPIWVEKLGPPDPPEIGLVDRQVTAPARRSLKIASDHRPDTAYVIGERLYLRPFAPEEGKLVSQWSLEDTEISYPEGRLILNAHMYGHMHKDIATKEIPTWIRFAIVLRETDELIGCNGLENVDWVHRTAETETEIFRPANRNAGYGTDAKHLLLEYAFEHLGLHMIYSYVSAKNPRSGFALKKQGYREAGTFGWDTFSRDGLSGFWTFDLLAAEWRAARDAAERDS
ncbi:hypothetical protein BH23CHL5_BH23CHL5_26350 [soil metagenome]